MLQRQDKLGLVNEGGQVYWLDNRLELGWFLFKPIDWLTQFLFFSASLLTIWLTRFEINSVAAKSIAGIRYIFNYLANVPNVVRVKGASLHSRDASVFNRLAVFKRN